MGEHYLKFDNLGKQYGYQWAVRSASGKIHPNSYISLFGANGAGKSTLLYLLSGVYRAQEGELSYGKGLNKKTFHHTMQLMSHQSMLYHRLNALENLSFFQSLYGEVSDDDISRALEFTGLEKHKYKTVDGYSRGMLQRLMLARLLLARPEIVFFDEPFTGLDIRGQKLLLSILENRGVAEFDWKIQSYVFVDHDISRAYEHCEDVWFIENGSLKEKKSRKDIPLKQIREWLS